MPFFKAGPKLVYYAHVPKCGGSAVEEMLHARFGDIAFHDNEFTRQPAAQRWSKTSPQHIDRLSLDRLIPHSFFDAAFAIVRHPVARVVSAYHFQVEVEQSISQNIAFGDWLADLPEMMEANPFLYDNHLRSMDDIVPEGAQIFHLEHGLDALVPWFDALTGTKDGPRAVEHVNKRGAYKSAKPGIVKVEPTAEDRAMIARLYAADFTRFGYAPDRKEPAAAPPVLDPATLAEAEAARRAMASPMNQLRKKVDRVRRKVGI